MTHTAKRITDDDIRHAAIERFGAEDASVFKMTERTDADGRPIVTEWFVLSVQRGGQREIVGRRLSKTELLEMVKR